MNLNSRAISLNALKKSALPHITGWCIFIAYEITFVTLIIGSKSNSSVFSAYIYPYIINILLFYFHAHITLDKAFSKNKKNIFLLVLFVLLEIFLYLVALQSGNIVTGKNGLLFFSTEQEKIAFLRQLWRGIYFIGFSTAYWFVIQAIKKEKRIVQLEKTLVEIENAYLQAQINPHMLFNTLNFIYNEVEKYSDKAAETVLLLSELMRYSLTGREPDGRVNLDREIEQVKNIIKINQFRFFNKLFIQLDLDGDFEEGRIFPLLLLPFIENIFKHADLTDEHKPAYVSIRFNNDELEMITRNKKRNSKIFPSHGIGIDNVKKRLSKYYSGSFNLSYKEVNEEFQLFLKISLK
jgi:two-component system LytT family sensor kinase